MLGKSEYAMQSNGHPIRRSRAFLGSKKKLISFMVLITMLAALIVPPGAVPVPLGPQIVKAVGSTEMEGLVELNYYINESNARMIFNIGSGVTIPTNMKAKAVVDLTTDLIYQVDIDNTGEKVISIPLSSIPLGTSNVTLSILDGSNVLWSGQDQIVKRTAPAAGTVITQVDRNRAINLVNGEPFFTIGVIGATKSNLQTIKNEGFNTTMRWGKRSENTLKKYKREEAWDSVHNTLVVNDYLDAVAAAGLYAYEATFTLTEIPLYVSFRDMEFDNKWPTINTEIHPNIIKHAKNHPAVIGYYNYDEPDNFYECCPTDSRHLLMEEGVEDFYNVSKNLDPYHNVLTLFSVGITKPELADWDAWDVVARDFYPAESTHLSDVYDTVKESADRALDLRDPFIYTPLFERSDARFKPLSADEQRAQTYLGLIGGAKGILWWDWPALSNGNWESIKSIVDELNTTVTTVNGVNKKFSDVLLERSPEQVIQYPLAFGTDELIKAVVKNFNGESYLIVANADNSNVHVTFELPQMDGNAAVLFENRTENVVGGVFRDDFEPYGRHVYKLPGTFNDGDTVSLNVELGTSNAVPELVFPEPAAKKNKILNSSFEEEYKSVPGWPAKWSDGSSVLDSGQNGTLTGRWILDDTQAYHGNKSLKITKTLSGRPSTDELNYFGHAPGATQGLTTPSTEYTLSYWIKADAANTNIQTIVNGVGKTYDICTSGTPCVWEKQTFTYTGGAGFRMHLRDQGNVWIDAVQIETGASSTAYENYNPIADTIAPNAPGKPPEPAVTSNTVYLRWKQPSDNAGVIKEYQVYRNNTLVGTTRLRAFADTGLSASTQYTYTVKAIDAANNVSAASEGRTVTTSAAGTDTEAPTAPSSLTATPVSSSQINLSWNASADNVGVTGYQILRDGSQIGTTSGTTYSNTGLAASTTYSYTVKAYDASGNYSSASNMASATTDSGGGSTLFSDNFENGSGNWTVVSGTWGLTTDGSQVYQQTNTSGSGLATAGQTWTDYSVSADVKRTGGSEAVLVGRVAANNQFYQLHITGTAWGVYKNSSNTWTQLASGTGTYDTSTFYNLKLTFEGSTIKAYIDGVLIATVTDTSFSSGKIGLRTYNGSARFDNVLVEEIAPPGPTFSDDFESGAGNWTVVQGTTWTLATDNGSQVYSQPLIDAHMGASLVTAGNSTWTDYTVSADVRKLSYHRAGIVGRVGSGTNQFYELFIATNYDPDQWHLVKVDGSSNTVIASGEVSPSITSTDYYNLKMNFSGSTISVYIDDVLKGSVSDSSYSAGHIGLRTNPSAANFDNVLVSN